MASLSRILPLIALTTPDIAAAATDDPTFKTELGAQIDSRLIRRGVEIAHATASGDVRMTQDVLYMGAWAAREIGSNHYDESCVYAGWKDAVATDWYASAGIQYATHDRPSGPWTADRSAEALLGLSYTGFGLKFMPEVLGHYDVTREETGVEIGIRSIWDLNELLDNLSLETRIHGGWIGAGDRNGDKGPEESLTYRYAGASATFNYAILDSISLYAGVQAVANDIDINGIPGHSFGASTGVQVKF